MSNETNISIGGGLPSLLTVLFVGLKLTGHIDWSWWWVLSPLWIPVAIVLGALVVIGAITVVILVVRKIGQWRRR